MRGSLSYETTIPQEFRTTVFVLIANITLILKHSLERVDSRCPQDSASINDANPLDLRVESD